MSDKPDVYVSGAGEPVGRAAAGAPGAELRADPLGHRAPAQRAWALGRGAAGRVAELTDWRRQVREHKREIVIGAAIVGFTIGARMMLRRRRR